MKVTVKHSTFEFDLELTPNELIDSVIDKCLKRFEINPDEYYDLIVLQDNHLKIWYELNRGTTVKDSQLKDGDFLKLTWKERKKPAMPKIKIIDHHDAFALEVAKLVLEYVGTSQAPTFFARLQNKLHDELKYSSIATLNRVNEILYYTAQKQIETVNGFFDRTWNENPLKEVNKNESH